MFPIATNIRTTTFPLATWTLIILNTLIFLFELSLPHAILERFIGVFGLVPAHVTMALREGGPGLGADVILPLITSMFLHGGAMHLFGNMWSLYLFGGAVEDRMGPGRYLVFYFLCGLAAGATHVWTSPMSEVPTIGASGAVAGVLGAYFLFFPRAKVVLLIPILFWPFFFELPAATYLIFWAVMQLLNGVMTLQMTFQGAAGGIAWMAHAGGFAAGVMLCFLFAKPKRYRWNFDPGEFAFDQAWKKHL